MAFELGGQHDQARAMTLGRYGRITFKASSHGAGRFDVHVLFDAQRVGADDASGTRNDGDSDGHHHVGNRTAQHGDDCIQHRLRPIRLGYIVGRQRLDTP
jgi:hypothetical protein